MSLCALRRQVASAEETLPNGLTKQSNEGHEQGTTANTSSSGLSPTSTAATATFTAPATHIPTPTPTPTLTTVAKETVPTSSDCNNTPGSSLGHKSASSNRRKSSRSSTALLLIHLQGGDQVEPRPNNRHTEKCSKAGKAHISIPKPTTSSPSSSSSLSSFSKESAPITTTNTAIIAARSRPTIGTHKRATKPVNQGCVCEAADRMSDTVSCEKCNRLMHKACAESLGTTSFESYHCPSCQTNLLCSMRPHELTAVEVKEGATCAFCGGKDKQWLEPVMGPFEAYKNGKGLFDI